MTSSRNSSKALSSVQSENAFFGLFYSDRAAIRKSKQALQRALPANIFVDHSVTSTVFVDSGGASEQVSKISGDALLPVGTIVDKYRLDAPLGSGGFGVVYRATHVLMQRQVAIKFLRPKILQSRPALADLLCKEARFAAKINHPNVVQVFDITQTVETTFVVMEYVEGLTLAQAIRQQSRIPPTQLLSIAIDVVDGLSAALQSGLIHRDIKPQNIMLTTSGIAKLLDLGLACSVAEASEAPGERGSVVGTVGYMAPEQIDRPELVDYRTDIYSLGVTMFYAATGQPIYPANDARECIKAHRSAPIPWAHAIVRDFPPAISQLLQWMVAKHPDDRPASYAVLSSHLRQMRDEMVKSNA